MTQRIIRAEDPDQGTPLFWEIGVPLWRPRHIMVEDKLILTMKEIRWSSVQAFVIQSAKTFLGFGIKKVPSVFRIPVGLTIVRQQSLGKLISRFEPRKNFPKRLSGEAHQQKPIQVIRPNTNRKRTVKTW